MNSTLLLDFLCDLILSLLNTITSTFLTVLRLSHQFQSNEPSHQRLTRLQATRSALVIQQEILSRQIASIDELINRFNQHNTPPCPRSRFHTRQPSIGIPYPIPYTPPRTPEEERKNNIIAWVNKLRQQK